MRFTEILNHTLSQTGATSRVLSFRFFRSRRSLFKLQPIDVIYQSLRVNKSIKIAPFNAVRTSGSFRLAGTVNSSVRDSFDLFRKFILV
jgi:hypothetical protein